jgi:small GTP-binding protein
MLGYFSVGKTSLVSRFVHSVFSEQYLTTIGVKVDKKIVDVNASQIQLMLWDIEGEDKFCSLKKHYLRGMSGYVLVVDITRHNSYEKALEIKARLEENFGVLPHVIALNKNDLVSERDITEEEIEALAIQRSPVVFTSASTGAGVEEMFRLLAGQFLGEERIAV